MPTGSNLSSVQGNTPLQPTSTVSVPVNSDETNSVSNSQVMGGRDVSEANNAPETKSFREKFNDCCNKIKDFFAPLGQKQTWVDIGRAIVDGTQRGWDNAVDGLKGITPGFESQKQRNERINEAAQVILQSVDNMMDEYSKTELSEAGESFLKHTQKEFSSENVLVFSNAGRNLYPQGRLSDSEEDRLNSMTNNKHHLMAFSREFVEVGSDFEINISHRTRNRCVAAIDLYVNQTPPTPPTGSGHTQDEWNDIVESRYKDVCNTIEESLNEVNQMMRNDTFSRFTSSNH